ncbi:acetylxylan esterase [Cellulomonas sp. NPDC089187]|uniref:acetylxylan esterase n=1 Tax=Cellulomonas sp. NPDC089187 TaxID=3154970 RepID=UPI0034223E54
MTQIDLPLSALREYRPEVSAPADFDEFWARTLAEARRHQTPVLRRRVDSPLRLVDVDDVTFPGFAGDPIRAWLVRPAGVENRLPVIVEFNGYNGGRGLPHERLAWPTAGYAHLFVDSRGQGSGWGSGGDTPDPHGSGPAGPGFLTRGILDPEQHYFRRLITDCVRAVDAVRTLDGIDPDRVVAAGGSQGGGLTIAVAGLVDGLAAAMPDVPFLCHIARGVEVSDTDPYSEITRYLAVHRDQVDQVFNTLAYVDGLHHAARATAPSLFSVALQDMVCPPSTVFATHHAWAGPSTIEVYPYNQHEGGGGHHWQRQASWLREVLGS